LFLDYYGMPHIDSYLSPLVVFVDMAHKTAALPGTNGEEIVSFTYTKDLGKFVVAAMELEKWDESMWCYSENTTFKKLLEVAEEVTGSYPPSRSIPSHLFLIKERVIRLTLAIGTKFTVTFDSEEKLARNEITELPSHPYLYPYIPKPLLVGLLAKFGLWAVKGVMVVPHEGSLNERFPEVQTKSVQDVVGAWKGR
jgi:hypothetical protein